MLVYEVNYRFGEKYDGRMPARGIRPMCEALASEQSERGAVHKPEARSEERGAEADDASP